MEAESELESNDQELEGEMNDREGGVFGGGGRSW